MNKFGSKVTSDREEDALLEVKQHDGEALWSYYDRYEKMARKIPAIKDDIYVMAFKARLGAGDLLQSILLKRPYDKEDILRRVNEYIHMKEAMKMKDQSGDAEE